VSMDKKSTSRDPLDIHLIIGKISLVWRLHEISPTSKPKRISSKTRLNS